MDGIVALLLSKKFTKDTVIGMGAIKGAACQVQSINKVGKTTTITLKWEDNDGGIHTQAFDIEDGLDGVSVQNANIKPNGHLELTLSDGNTIDCGKVLPQYDIMPTPSSSNEGQILQYIGTTTSNYTNGYFYQCVESPVGSGTYVWVQKNVQPNNGGGGGDGVVDGYYSSADQLFYEENTFINPITGDNNTLYVSLDTNLLYRYNGLIFIRVDENGSGGSDNVVEGYFNSTNNLFYEEPTYITPITGARNVIYISLDTNFEYRYNGLIFEQLDVQVSLNNTEVNALVALLD